MSGQFSSTIGSMSTIEKNFTTCILAHTMFVKEVLYASHSDDCIFISRENELPVGIFICNMSVTITCTTTVSLLSVLSELFLFDRAVFADVIFRVTFMALESVWTFPSAR